jgi:hypothetical protein
MKVEHVVPAPQESQPEILRGVDNDKADDPASNINDRAMPGKPQFNKDTPLSSYDVFDVELALEHDELLDKPDTRTTSHGPKVWQVKESTLKLSALEATVAVKRGLYTYDDFTL